MVPPAPGSIDENGYVRITGRLKDIIIRKGENISARRSRTCSTPTRRS
jgi:acyl-CoA synthetase (AMP-forming)/AMP-acid ligase II